VFAAIANLSRALCLPAKHPESPLGRNPKHPALCLPRLQTCHVPCVCLQSMKKALQKEIQSIQPCVCRDCKLVTCLVFACKASRKSYRKISKASRKSSRKKSKASSLVFAAIANLSRALCLPAKHPESPTERNPKHPALCLPRLQTCHVPCVCLQSIQKALQKEIQSIQPCVCRDCKLVTCLVFACKASRKSYRKISKASSLVFAAIANLSRALCLPAKHPESPLGRNPKHPALCLPRLQTCHVPCVCLQSMKKALQKDIQSIQKVL